MIPSQRSLRDNTQHSQQTDIHAPAGFEPAITENERPQRHASVRGPLVETQARIILQLYMNVEVTFNLLATDFFQILAHPVFKM